MQQFQPESPANNLPLALKLKGRLDVEALRQALNTMVRRHTILRTVFPFVQGKVVAVVQGDGGPEVKLEDLSDIPPEGRETQARHLLAGAAGRPFDLSRGPLVRVVLVRFKADEHLLLLVMHRIIGDASSANLLASEMVSGYAAAVMGQPAPRAAAPLQYQDFTRWQRQEVDNDLQGRSAFWKHRLRDAPVLELPTDRPRPPIQTYNGAMQGIRLPGDLAEALKELSRRHDTSLSVILLAALQTLLYRYTQHEDIVVGCAVDGRHRPETHGLIGCCDNTLALRVHLESEASFEQVLARVHCAWQEAWANQDLPFAKVLEEVPPPRDMSRTPFFQVLFDFVEHPWKGQQIDELIIESWAFDPGIAPYDVTLKVLADHDGLQCLFIYNTDLFETPTVGRLMGHYQTLLQGIVANPGELIFRLPLLTAVERRQILVEWNDTTTAYPKDRCIHELFAEQAVQRPQAPALSFGGPILTYGQLDARANRWAHHLRRLGVGPDVPVGICMEPAVEMLVGVLGILKAGGCYVPLDTDYPSERITFMLADTQAKVLLTQPHLMGAMPEGDALTICVDPKDAEVLGEGTETPANVARPDNLACIFYTSGSTGTPKGVPVPHYAVQRLVRNTNYLDFQPGDRIAQASNISFDGATWEIWGALLNGGCLVGLPRDILVSSHDFAAFIQEKKINVMFLTPALFHQFAREVPDAFRSVRDLIMGGDILEPRWVKAVMQHGPPDRLLNGYGPTESTTFATCYLVPDIPEDKKAIPIGRPISNTTVYILDRNLQLVPVGVHGELCIGGDGLAQGYLHRPEQTAEKFIPHPFSQDPQTRLYKTGDWARFLPDGNIDFLGRMDHQVKIRGFRIEPGEIEATLLSHAGVENVLVLAQEDEPGDKRLVAYITPSRHSCPSVEGLRAFLRDRLPSYMIPAFYMFLEKFPLTPNGKVDRGALPAPDRGRGGLKNLYVGPRDEMEGRLVEVWEAVLGVKPIGVHDDFFSLGGHSLLAARLFVHLENISGVKPPLSLIYQRPTVAQLAEAFKDRGVSGVGTGFLVVPIHPAGTRPPFFMIQGFESLPHLRRALGEEQPLYSLRSPLELNDYKLLRTGVQGLAAHYLQAIREVQGRGRYFLGGFSAGGVLAYEIARQMREEGDEVALLFLLDPTPYEPGPYFSEMPAVQHLDSLARIGAREKLAYLSTHLCNLLKKLAFRTMQSGLPLPPALLPAFYGEVIYAVRNYDPPHLPVRTLLVQSEEGRKELTFSWPEVLSGPREVHAVQAGHLELCKLPHVLVWTDLLRTALLNAQEMTGTPGV
ncbi:MAG: amino acid adenylation domain-containing protein [Desulfobaccales bacterium]